MFVFELWYVIVYLINDYGWWFVEEYISIIKGFFR